MLWVKTNTGAILMLLFLAAGTAAAQGRGAGSPPGAGQQDDSRGVGRRGRRVHGPGPHAGDWLRRHQGLSLEDQERALEQDPGFRSLDPERQDRLRQRLERFNSLAPQQQERILQRMENFEHLTPEQQERARRSFLDFQQLPPDRRRVMTEALRELRAASPEQRQQLLDSSSFRERFSAREREILGSFGQMSLVPGRGREREPHPEQ